MPTLGVRAASLSIAAAVVVVIASPHAAAIDQSPANERTGARHWQIAPSPGRAIEGYASALSVVAGEPLTLRVSTSPAHRYRVEVYRLGWYGGAGAQLVACLPSCSGSRMGRARPVPPPDPRTGEVVAHWPITDTIRTVREWRSGEYLAQLVLIGNEGPRAGRTVPFAVRPATEQRRAVLVEVPVDTWEAYNNWGGKSLYAYNSSRGVPAVKVSFDRPWAYGDPNVTFPTVFEYPMLRFLERTGFPLEYVTDIDVDRNPGLLLEHRLSVTLGHGEYWSERIRDAWDAARQAGRNLAFLGANIGYWQIRYENGGRTIVEYRSATADPDPVGVQKTTNFRALDPPRPECELIGVEFQGGGLHPPLVNPYTVAAGRNPWLREAGLHPGDRLPGAVSGEWDAVQPGCPSEPTTVLFQYAGSYPADATLTTTTSGGHVLALGTEGFGSLVDGWGRSPCQIDQHAERFLRIALSALAGLRVNPHRPPVPACPRTR